MAFDKPIALPSGYRVVFEKPGFFSNLHAFAWNLTKGRNIYYKCRLEREGVTVCFAEMTTSSFFIRVLRKMGGGIEEYI